MKKRSTKIGGNISVVLTISFLLMMSCYQLNAQIPLNCSEIHFVNPTAPDGVYTIDPDGSGPIPSMNCQCDMTTDGGGWTLVLNYNHLVGTNPPLKIRIDSLPLQGQTNLGFDESNTIYWGHADTALMNAIPFDEVRFYGITAEHNRVMNFTTSHGPTISYFKTGIGSTLGISSSFTPLGSHTTNLPAAINMTTTNQGNYAMTAYPLWTGSTYHWYLGGGDITCAIRWEVDDYPCTIPSTFHQIWVKQTVGLGMNGTDRLNIEMNVAPNPFKEKATVTLANCTTEQFEKIELKIVNVLGESVNPVIIKNEGSFTIEKSGLSAGIYFCQLVNENGVVATEKLVVE